MSFFLFFSLLKSLLKSFGAESLFPPVEEEGEEDGYGPVGYGVGDVGFGSSVVESREDVGFGEHVDDFDGEYQGADKLAKAGSGYKDIIGYYYKDVTVVDISSVRSEQ